MGPGKEPEVPGGRVLPRKPVSLCHVLDDAQWTDTIKETSSEVNTENLRLYFSLRSERWDKEKGGEVRKKETKCTFLRN